MDEAEALLLSTVETMEEHHTTSLLEVEAAHATEVTDRETRTAEERQKHEDAVAAHAVHLEAIAASAMDGAAQEALRLQLRHHLGLSRRFLQRHPSRALAHW